MKKYEAIFILDDQKFEDAGAALIKDAEELVTKLGGSVENTDNMGQRQLSYQIGKRRTGLYWCLVLFLPEDQVANLKERYRLNDSVLRLEVFTYDRPEVVQLPERGENAESE